MVASDTYVHGTSPTEQIRLARLNALTNQAFLDFLPLEPNMRVLEVGCGLGILTSAVASRQADARVVGLERSSEQLANARLHPRVAYVRGDAHALAFCDGHFDLTYCRYVLEHVQQPERVTVEMHRVTKAGGVIAVLENDISLVRLDPPCPAFDAAWLALAAYQRRLGGDPLIGRRLYRLLRQAGFRNIELSLAPEVHWHGRPSFGPFIQNLQGNLTGVLDGLVRTRLATAQLVGHAIEELSAFAAHVDASATFAWHRARATR